MTLSRIRTPLFLALVALAAQAQAQKAAFVQDRDSPGRAPYQQREALNQTSASCPNNFYCVFTFAPVPAGQRLVITHASAEFTNGISGMGVAYVSGPEGLFGPRQIIPSSGVTPSNRTIASGPMTYYVEGGQTPTVIITGNNIMTGNSAFTTLSGYLVTLP